MIATNTDHKGKELAYGMKIYIDRCWGKKIYAVYAYICSSLFFSVCPDLATVCILESWGKSFPLSFEVIKATRRKVLWVSVVDNRLPKKKVVSVLLWPSFLALHLQCVDYEELGFPLLQQFWQQAGAANAKSL